MSSLQHFGSEGDDSHIVFLSQFPRDGSEDTGPSRLFLIVNDNGGVVIESDVRTVRSSDAFAGSDDDRLDDFALFDGAARELPFSRLR